VTDFYEKNPIDYLAAVMPNVRGIRALVERYKAMERARFMQFVSRYNAIDNIGRVTPRPVLIVQGDSDLFCSVSDASELSDKGGSSTTLNIIENGDHFFSTARLTAIERTVNWLTEKMALPPPNRGL